MKWSTWVMGATLAALSVSAAQARVLDPTKPADALEIMKRIQCGEKDGQAAVFSWSGHVYSRVDGEPDRLLFNAEGMNIRQCVTVTDPQHGLGYRQVSREVMFYIDPMSGAILRQWSNPWTRETVDVMQVANDPVNSRPSFPIAADGKPFSVRLTRSGNWVQIPIEVPLFYDNPLAGAYQDFIGNKYHAMEIFDFSTLSSDLFDTRMPTAHPTVSWVRISDWMPWMKMRGRQGNLVFNAMGTKLKSYDELPPTIKDEIAAHYPDYRTPPPADDARTNATTWTVFKDQIDASRQRTK